MSVPEYKTVIKDIPTSILNKPTQAPIPQNNTKLVYQPKKPVQEKLIECDYIPNAGENPTVSNFIFNPAINSLKPPPTKTNFTFSEPIIDEETIYSEKDKSKGQMFVNKLQEELENIKKEKQKYNEKKKKKAEEQKQQNLVITQSNKKSEYITHDEINAKREKILKDFEESKESFYAKRQKDQEALSRYLQLNDGLGDLKKTEELMKERNDHDLTSLNAIKKDISEPIDKNKLKKNKSLQKMYGVIRRRGYNNCKPVEIKDEKFIKRFAKYLLMKKLQNEILGLDDNYDDEPVKFGIQTDYTENTFQSRFLTTKLGADTKKGGSNLNDISSFMQSELKMTNNNLSSYIAFSKMIFALLDKDKKGAVTKEEVLQGIAIDEPILKDLGFESADNFLLLINIYEPIQSDKKDELSENDFIMFLLSKTEFKDEVYNNLFKPTGGHLFNKNNIGKKRRRGRKAKFENQDEVDISEDSDADLPGLRTHVFDFLECGTNEEKLAKLNVILENTKTYNKRKHLGTSEYGRGPVKMRLKLTNERIRISYTIYLNFLRSFQTKDQINFTIPEPFEFLKRDYMQHKLEKIKSILEEKIRIINENKGEPFHAIKLKEGIWGNQMEGLMEREKKARMKRQEKIKERIVAEMKPFSFYDEDERKYMEKIRRECQPPVFPPFRAGPIKWLSQVNIYEDMMIREKEERQKRIEERKQKTLKASKLPPRMEAAKKQAEEKAKRKPKRKNYFGVEEEEPKQQKEAYRFKANEVPDFKKLQEDFDEKLNSMKSSFVPTKPIPFFMHEPKKKIDLYPVDLNNNPQNKNPQKKTNIKKVVKNMKKKPKFEPSSTQGLNMLMNVNRELLEKREKEKKQLEKEQNERNERYKEASKKVQKALREKEEEFKKEREERDDNIKRRLKRKEQEYKEDLKRRMERVNNRPLLFQQSSQKKQIFFEENYDEGEEEAIEEDEANNEIQNEGDNIQHEEEDNEEQEDQNINESKENENLEDEVEEENKEDSQAREDADMGEEMNDLDEEEKKYDGDEEEGLDENNMELDENNMEDNNDYEEEEGQPEINDDNNNQSGEDFNNERTHNELEDDSDVQYEDEKNNMENEEQFEDNSDEDFENQINKKNNHSF